MKLLKTVAAAALCVALSACALVTSAPPGPYKVGATSVTLGRQWSDVSILSANRPKNVRVLSIDGLQLNALYVTDGLAPGQPLVMSRVKERPTPVYRTGLSPNELVEFLTASVEAMGYEQVKVAKLKPIKTASGDGIRVNLTAKTKAGLEITGSAALLEKGGKLYVVLYLAPTEHYYDATLPEAEAVMASLTAG